MNGRERDRWLVHGGGVLVLAGLAYAAHALGVQPVVATRTAAAAQAAAAAELQSAVQAGRSRLAAVERRIGATADELAEVPLQVRPLSDLNRRFADVVDLAAACGLLVSHSRTEAARPETWFVRVPIRLEGRGPVAGVASFFQRVQDELPDVEILAFDLTRVGGPEAEAMLVSIDLAWYAASGSASAR